MLIFAAATDIMPLKDFLLAVGVTLVVVGFVMRGFAANKRRDLARRRQHARDARTSREAGVSDELEKAAGWLERNLGLLANVVLGVGAAIALAGILS